MNLLRVYWYSDDKQQILIRRIHLKSIELQILICHFYFQYMSVETKQKRFITGLLLLFE